MTTINCSLNCKYQRDGQCNLDNLCSLPISSHPDCAYFQPLECTSKKMHTRSGQVSLYF